MLYIQKFFPFNGKTVQNNSAWNTHAAIAQSNNFRKARTTVMSPSQGNVYMVSIFLFTRENELKALGPSLTSFWYFNC